MTALLEASDLAVHFRKAGLLAMGGDVVRAVDGVSLRIGRGECLGLVGESGCGKSTLGRALLRAAPITAGRVCFDGTDITQLGGRALRAVRSRMQMVFQDPYGSLDPRMTVEAIVGEPIVTHERTGRRSRRARVGELLETVGIDPARMGDRPAQFSGGQRQRIAIARALAVRPDFILCDEVTSALDVSIRAQILNLLKELRQEHGLTYLMISHDLGSLRHLSDAIGVMYLGRIVEMGPAQRVFGAPMHPYTQSLLSAMPLPDPERERARSRIVLKDDVPSPLNIPPGCRFHTRCPLRERLGTPGRCAAEEPLLRPLPDGRTVACHYAEEAAAPPNRAPREPVPETSRC